MTTPYIGFSNSTLDKMPKVQVGHTFICIRCKEVHKLEPADDGSFLLGFYRCGGKSYLGAVNGRLVVDAKLDISGRIP